MADSMVTSRIKFQAVDPRKLPQANANTWSATLDTGTNDILALRARLNTISSTLYPTAYLNTMSVNDMLYAIRMADDPLSF